MAQPKSEHIVKKNAFVHKLYDMLNNKLISHLIWWSETPEANTFLLSPNKEFAEALSSYFKHENVASFVRQLHMYGFHKVSDPTPSTDKGSAIWEFRHSLGKFRKNDEASLVFIKRRLQLNSLSHVDHDSAASSHPEIGQYYYQPQYVQFIPNMPIYGPQGVGPNHVSYQANIHNQQALAHNQAFAHNQALATNFHLAQNHPSLAQNFHHPTSTQPPAGYSYYPMPLPPLSQNHISLLHQQQVPQGYPGAPTSVMFPHFASAQGSPSSAVYGYAPNSTPVQQLTPMTANSQFLQASGNYQGMFPGKWAGNGGDFVPFGSSPQHTEMGPLKVEGDASSSTSVVYASNHDEQENSKPIIADILPHAPPLQIQDPHQNPPTQPKVDNIPSTSKEDTRFPSFTPRSSWGDRQSLLECITPVGSVLNLSKEGRSMEHWQPRPIEVAQTGIYEGSKLDSSRHTLPSITESVYYSTTTQIPSQQAAHYSTLCPEAKAVLDTTFLHRTRSYASSEASSAVSIAFPPDSDLPRLPSVEMKMTGPNDASKSMPNIPSIRSSSLRGLVSHLLNDSPPTKVVSENGHKDALPGEDDRATDTKDNNRAENSANDHKSESDPALDTIQNASDTDGKLEESMNELKRNQNKVSKVAKVERLLEESSDTVWKKARQS